MVSLLDNSKIAPATFARLTAPASAIAEPPETANLPAEIVVVPVYVLVPERVSVGVPALVNAPPPDIAPLMVGLYVPEKVSVLVFSMLILLLTVMTGVVA